MWPTYWGHMTIFTLSESMTGEKKNIEILIVALYQLQVKWEAK